MEDHLRNKNRLMKEWEALCSYQAEPSAVSVAQSEANAKKNRCPDSAPCEYRPLRRKKTDLNKVVMPECRFRRPLEGEAEGGDQPLALRLHQRQHHRTFLSRSDKCGYLLSGSLTAGLTFDPPSRLSMTPACRPTSPPRARCHTPSPTSGRSASETDAFVFTDEIRTLEVL